MKARIIPIAAALTAAVIAAASYQAAIKWTPKVGASYDYNMNARMTVQGMEVSVSSTINRKIDKMDGEKVIVIETQGSTKINFGGQEMEQPGGKSTQTTAANGEVLEAKNEPDPQMDMSRMMEAMAFNYPKGDVKVGDTWKRTNDGKKKGTVADETTYKYEGDEEMNGKKCWKVSYTFKETDGDTKATATGTYWISQEDTEMVKSTVSLKNGSIEGVGNFDMEASTVRK